MSKLAQPTEIAYRKRGGEWQTKVCKSVNALINFLAKCADEGTETRIREHRERT